MRLTACTKRPSTAGDVAAAQDNDWVGLRRSGTRSHRRKAGPQVERSDSRHPRSAVADPNRPDALLQSGRPAGHRSCGLTTMKRTFVVSLTRPEADLPQPTDLPPAAQRPENRLQRDSKSWSGRNQYATTILQAPPVAPKSVHMHACCCRTGLPRRQAHA